MGRRAICSYTVRLEMILTQNMRNSSLQHFIKLCGPNSDRGCLRSHGCRSAGRNGHDRPTAAVRTPSGRGTRGCISAGACSRCRRRCPSCKDPQLGLGFGRSLVDRARAVLEAAEVLPAGVLALSAAVGRSRLGSACDVVFRDRAACSRAKVAVRGLWREFVDGRRVWLDRRQSPEARTVKSMHKAVGMLRDLEGACSRPPGALRCRRQGHVDAGRGGQVPRGCAEDGRGLRHVNLMRSGCRGRSRILGCGAAFGKP